MPHLFDNALRGVFIDIWMQTTGRYSLVYDLSKVDDHEMHAH